MPLASGPNAKEGCSPGKGRENDAEHERKAERDTVSVRRLTRELDGNGAPEPAQQAHKTEGAHAGDPTSLLTGAPVPAALGSDQEAQC
jgi:hypothetical protein